MHSFTALVLLTAPLCAQPGDSDPKKTNYLVFPAKPASDMTAHKESLKWEVGSGVSSIAFSRDSNLLATGLWDTTAHVWDLTRLSRVGRERR